MSKLNLKYNAMLTAEDRKQLEEKGISESLLNEQLACFRNGFPYLKLSAPASVEKGILQLSEETSIYEDMWEKYVGEGHKVVKFVPASGAASRMFKNMFAFLQAEYDVPTTDFEKKFFEEVHRFAFFDDLDAACVRLYEKHVDELVAARAFKPVVSALLEKEGLNYGQLPKGLLKFHRYTNGARTPLEEHLVEGALYAQMAGGSVHMHFTVSKEHRAQFEQLVAEKSVEYAQKFGVTYDISFSEQKSATDTVAVTLDNELFRDDSGRLVFRPGGHGALIENLNDLDADVVFIKNIDNVVPDRLKSITVTYKKVIAGVLVQLQHQAYDYLRKLDSGMYSMDELLEMLQFVQKKLFCKNPSTKTLEDTELAIYLRQKLNRPIRVCGMVRNVGEPGGGPFLAYNPDGTISLQILESSQIDMSDPEAKAMFERGTHFNPVDLVCGVRDYKGGKFNLPDYVDKATGFISQKSKNGRELKALELPGLWNGAMSNWNTVFVEVPLETFNPVKTVNDLLREQHQ